MMNAYLCQLRNVLMVLGLALIAVSCGGGSDSPAGSSLEPLSAHDGLSLGGSAPAPGISGLPGLPLAAADIPVNRSLSFTNVVSYNGSGIYKSGGTQFYPNNATVLASSLSELSWVQYAFNTKGYQPERLSVDLTCNAGSVAYVGWSNYSDGRWNWGKAAEGPVSYELPAALYLNSLDQFFVTVVCSGGSSASVNYLSVRFDNDVIYEQSISGTIIDEHGAPLANQFIMLSPNPDNIQLVTDVDGSYFVGLPGTGMYTLEPQSMNTMYSPANEIVDVQGHETGVDFTGTRIDLRGRVATAEGTGVPGVALTLNPGGVTTVSGADGEYEFQGVADDAYTIDALLAGYAFDPVQQNAVVNGTDKEGVDFEASGGQPTYSISGNINDGVNPVDGVVLTLNPGWRIAFTDVNGNYSFSNLPPAQYTLKPAKGKWTFNPATRLVNLGGANENGVDFAATPPPPTFTVSGKVSWFDGMAYGIPSMKVVLKGINGTQGSYSAYTDAGGTYTIPNVENGDYKFYNDSLAFDQQFLEFDVNNNDYLANLNLEFKTGGPTWENFTASYVGNACTSCHRPDSQTAVDPPLRNYTEVTAVGSACNARIQNGTMPPGNPSLDFNKHAFSVWRLANYPLDDFQNP